MTLDTLETKVGHDGILNLNVPIGPAFADQDVVVKVEVSVKKPFDKEKYQAFLDSIVGKWQGEFIDPHERKLEERNELFP